MIIKEIHIDGFGIFSGYSLTSLGKGVNIISGNNEAGKSTLLKFIRYTLFGYPHYKDQRMPPLHGGRHGGRIKAALSTGKEVLFERSGDDQIRLLYNGTESRNQSQWSQLLGNASSELYNNVYAISLQELVGLESLSESGVEDKIFSVGLGLGNTSIGEVENSIQQRANDIYTPRGRVQVIPGILKELEKKKRKINDIQENLPNYQSLIVEIKQLEENIHELDVRIEGLRNKKIRLSNYMDCYHYFIKYAHAEAALNTLPDVQNYPERGMERLDVLEEKEQDLLKRIRELRDGAGDEKGLGELEESVESIMVNSPLMEKEEVVHYLDTNLEKYKQSIHDKNEEIRRIRDHEKMITQGITDINGGWDEGNVKGLTDLALHKNNIEGFKNNIESLAAERRDLEAQIKARKLNESSLNIRSIAVVFSVVSLFASIPAFYYGIFVLGGALVLTVLFLFFGTRYFRKEGARFKLHDLLDEIKMKEQHARKGYEEYLEQKLDLDPSLSPDATLDVFKSVQQLRKEILERDRLEEKISKQRLPFIQAFEREASAVAVHLENNAREDKTEILVGRIIAEFEQSRAHVENREKLREALLRRKKSLESAESSLGNTQSAITELLASAGASDQEDFRKKYEENSQVKELVRERESAIDTMEGIAGYNKSGEVIAYLRATEKEDIETEMDGLTRAIEIASKEFQDKSSALGGKRNEIKRIEGESELAEVLTEYETEKQKLRNAYKEWITGKVALAVLNEVKIRYEKEKQPEVIKRSSGYFKQITGERYQKIHVSLDDKNVNVYDKRERSKNIEHLSRGTREQLLISLRMGFIEEYENKSEPLPVIVDEVLVNFDPSRVGRTAEIMQQFGKTRQVFIFTCHPSTIDHFDQSSLRLTQMK